MLSRIKINYIVVRDKKRNLALPSHFLTQFAVGISSISSVKTIRCKFLIIQTMYIFFYCDLVSMLNEINLPTVDLLSLNDKKLRCLVNDKLCHLYD